MVSQCWGWAIRDEVGQKAPKSRGDDRAAKTCDTSHRMCYPISVYRVVLDSCVVIAAFRSRNGASYKLMQMVADRVIAPLATPALFFEYESVLKRPEQL